MWSIDKTKNHTQGLFCKTITVLCCWVPTLPGYNGHGSYDCLSLSFPHLYWLLTKKQTCWSNFHFSNSFLKSVCFPLVAISLLLFTSKPLKGLSTLCLSYSPSNSFSPIAIIIHPPPLSRWWMTSTFSNWMSHSWFRTLWANQQHWHLPFLFWKNSLHLASKMPFIVYSAAWLAHFSVVFLFPNSRFCFSIRSLPSFSVVTLQVSSSNPMPLNNMQKLMILSFYFQFWPLSRTPYIQSAPRFFHAGV